MAHTHTHTHTHKAVDAQTFRYSQEQEGGGPHKQPHGQTDGPLVARSKNSPKFLSFVSWHPSFPLKGSVVILKKNHGQLFLNKHNTVLDFLMDAWSVKNEWGGFPIIEY